MPLRRSTGTGGHQPWTACWNRKPLTNAGMAEYIRFAIKTFRKLAGEPIFITQEVEDIVSNPIVKNTIINLCDCKILLDMGKLMNRFDDIQRLLGMSEKDKALTLSLNRWNDPKRKYKEVHIMLGTSYSKVFGVEVSLEEYLAYTTEERERVMVTRYEEKYGSLQKGIQVLANEIREGMVAWNSL